MPEVPACLLSPEPSNRSQVLASPERTLWEAAECSEMEGLIEGKVWEQVERPEGDKSVGTKFVYKRKVDSNGNVEKYKARFVALGYQQVEATLRPKALAHAGSSKHPIGPGDCCGRGP